MLESRGNLHRASRPGKPPLRLNLRECTLEFLLDIDGHQKYLVAR